MQRSLLLLAATAGVAGFTAAPAAAAEPTTCQTYSVTIINGWSACRGFYSGNVMSGNGGDITTQTNAVGELGGSFDGNFAALFGFGSLGNGGNGARTINFGQTFYGETIIGAHFGNIGLPNDQYGNVTVFYKFDFGAAGASSIDFVQSRGLSNLYVYNNGQAVPEPATWALLTVAFGAIGASMRKRRKVAALAHA